MMRVAVVSAVLLVGCAWCGAAHGQPPGGYRFDPKARRAVQEEQEKAKAKRIREQARAAQRERDIEQAKRLADLGTNEIMRALEGGRQELALWAISLLPPDQTAMALDGLTERMERGLVVLGENPALYAAMEHCGPRAAPVVAQLLQQTAREYRDGAKARAAAEKAVKSGRKPKEELVVGADGAGRLVNVVESVGAQQASRLRTIKLACETLAEIGSDDPKVLSALKVPHKDWAALAKETLAEIQSKVEAKKAKPAPGESD